MSTTVPSKSQANYYRLTEALTKVYDIINEGNLNRPELIKDVDNYLHSVTTAFRNRHHHVLENHVPVLVDVDVVLRKAIAEKERKEEEDKWGKVVV